jgi:hypothetical protein
MERRFRVIATATLATVTLVVVCLAVSLSLNPENYFFYDDSHRSAWVYDPGNVALVCGLIVVEAAFTLTAFVAARPRALWLRCLLALALLGPWALFSTVAVMHMPVYILPHHVWVWLLIVSLVVALACSASSQLFLRLHGRQASI